jgi:hypothetical protein
MLLVNMRVSGWTIGKAKLYDRTREELTFEEVERIKI